MVGGYCGAGEEDAGFGAGGGDAGVFVEGGGGGEVVVVVVVVAGGLVSLHFLGEELSFLGSVIGFSSFGFLWWVLLRRELDVYTSKCM